YSDQCRFRSGFVPVGAGEGLCGEGTPCVVRRPWWGSHAAATRATQASPAPTAKRCFFLLNLKPTESFSLYASPHRFIPAYHYDSLMPSRAGIGERILLR